MQGGQLTELVDITDAAAAVDRGARRVLTTVSARTLQPGDGSAWVLRTLVGLLTVSGQNGV